MEEKWSKNDEDRRFEGDDEVNEGEKNRRDIRLFVTHQLDGLGDSLPFAFQLLCEGNDQDFQT